MLSAAPYSYLARPRLTADDPRPAGRNCRALLQDYFLERLGVFLPRAAVEQPGLWHRTGAFVELPAAAGPGVWDGLPADAILLGEKIRDGGGAPMDRSAGRFADLEEYRLHLHTAIWLPSVPAGLCAPDIPRDGVRDGDPAVLHATAAAGSTCLWSGEKFLQHYRLVAAKTV